MFVEEDIKWIIENVKSHGNKTVVSKKWPVEYEEIKKCKGDSWSEKLYNYLYPQHPAHCKICGAPLKYKNFKAGYGLFCSTECSYKDPDVVKRRKQTCLERYGVEIPLKLEHIKKKQHQTCLERYGVESTGQVKEFREKAKKTCLERYGVESYSQTKIGREKISSGDKSRILKRHDNLIDIKPGSIWVMKCPHPECKECEEKFFETPYQLYKNRLRDNSEVCTKLLPIQPLYSTDELRVCDWLDEEGIEYEHDNRKILGGKELDIYIPSKNVAIEVNGILWHSSKYKDNSYHINKYKLCKSKGIRLITLWEDQLKNKPNICKDIVMRAIGNLPINIEHIKCSIVDVKNVIADAFLKENSIFQNSDSQYTIGYEYNNELVSILGFDNCGNDCRINYYEGKNDHFVIGGLENLINKLHEQYEKIYVDVHNDCEDINQYIKLGFVHTQISDPQRYFIRSDKSIRVKEIADSFKYYEIYDCGRTSLILS